MHLTRPDFDMACEGLLAKYASYSPDSLSLRLFKKWAWHEHPSLSGFGFMSRTNQIHRHARPKSPQQLEEPDLEQDDDTTVAALQDYEYLTCQQYVVYSATFQVPAFYFTIHDSNGSPLSLTDLVLTSLFHPFAFQGTELSSFAVTLPSSAFPLLSQGEHPTLGTPSWFFHPCETANSVGEIMAQVEDNSWTAEERAIRWLEAWFMIVGNIVDLRTSD
ncbi:hypothetical protein C8J56DRAFT_934793 [Mycena floridula]|nr:hypothetical protein C8J56DRAFT_934793 [Mycena floridula]